MYVRTTERDEAGVSPVDLSPCSGEFHQLLGLMEAGEGRGKRERGEEEGDRGREGERKIN